jgi:RES domain-containing protein
MEQARHSCDLRSGYYVTAALEVLVHHGMLPADHRLINITIPDSIQIENVDVSMPGEDWFQESSEKRTAVIGSEWANSMRSAVLQVPSAVIRTESNYILNPRHPDFSAIVFDVSDANTLDERLRNLPRP